MESERLRSLEVDHQLKCCGLPDRKVGRLGPFISAPLPSNARIGSLADADDVSYSRHRVRAGMTATGHERPHHVICLTSALTPGALDRAAGGGAVVWHMSQRLSCATYEAWLC